MTKKKDKKDKKPNVNLSVDAERKICYYMNLDHAVILYAIVKSTLPRKFINNKNVKISNPELVNINLESATINFVACDEKTGTCAKKNVIVKFDPPVESQLELRPRLISMQDQMMQPKLSWFFLDARCRMILISMGLLGYAHYFCDLNQLITNNPDLGRFFIALFGSVNVMALVVKICWYFGVAAHLLEAIYGAYLCKSTLELSTFASFLWFVAISLVGYPMTTKVIEFTSIKTKNLADKAKLKST